MRILRVDADEGRATTKGGVSVSSEERLAALGLTLPEPPQPAGSYVTAKRVGRLIYVSGMVPMTEGTLRHRGKVGADVSLEEGYEAARVCALNILSVLKAEIGSLDRIAQMVRVGGFVCSADGFTDQPKVINGASDLFVEVFQERGMHARAAIGVSELPLGSAVEVEAIAEVA